MYAVVAGKVRFLRSDWVSGVGSGNYVHLEHQDIGCETRYAHLSEVDAALSDGAPVVAGQLIGAVGGTGASYSHLHFEVRAGLGGTQRDAIHPLSTPALPWTDSAAPGVELIGVFADSSGLTALVVASSPLDEPDVSQISVEVDGGATDARAIDYAGLNAGTAAVARLDDPLVNDVCMIPKDLSAENGYKITAVFRRLSYQSTSAVSATVTDVGGNSSTSSSLISTGLDVLPVEQTATAGPGQTVSMTYTLTNQSGTSDTFALSHLSAQGWPAVVSPGSVSRGAGESATITATITVDTASFGPPDCGILLAESQSTSRTAGGFYRVLRPAHVDGASGVDSPSRGTREEPFASISYALANTDAGGAVHVAYGTYRENLKLTETVDLMGGYLPDWSARTLAANETVVDGGGVDSVVEVDGDVGPLIEGLTLMNGSRSGGGGGIRVVGGAAPTVRSNWIVNNTSTGGSGGIFVGSLGTLLPTIVDNVISGNTLQSLTGGGGGIYVDGRPVLIEANLLEANLAENNDGGGLYLTDDTAATVVRNRVLSNVASADGGGVLVRSDSAYLANNVISGNSATGNGVAIGVFGASAPHIVNNTLVASGPGGGVAVYVGSGSAPTLSNNIIASYAGGAHCSTEVGAHCSTEVTVSFSLLFNATDLSGSCLGVSNLAGVPALLDEVHLSPDSPAVDAGELASYVPAVDFDGDPRHLDGARDGSAAVDIGADELVPAEVSVPVPGLSLEGITLLAAALMIAFLWRARRTGRPARGTKVA